MAEAMSTAPEGETREQAYQRLAREIASVVAGETSATARYATAACLLAHAFAPRFFLDRILCGGPAQAARAGGRPLSGHAGLPAYPLRQGRVRGRWRRRAKR